MSNAIHITASHSGTSGQNAMLKYDLGATKTKFFVRYQVYCPAASMTAWASSLPYIFLISPDTVQGDFVQQIGLNTGGALLDGFGNWAGGNNVFTADAWHTVEFFVDSAAEGSPGWYKVDGRAGAFANGDELTPYATGTFDTRMLFFGLDGISGFSATGSIDTEMWIGKVQIGTDAYLHDILDYDPATTSYTPTFGANLAGTSSVAMAAPPVAVPASMDPAASTGSIKINYTGHHASPNKQIGVGVQLGAHRTHVYSKIEFLVSTVDAATLGSVPGLAQISTLMDFPTFSGSFPSDYAEVAGLYASGSNLDSYMTQYGAHNGGSLTPDVWHTLEVDWAAGSTSTLKVDGTTVLTYTGQSATGSWDSMFFWAASVFAFGAMSSSFTLWLNKIQIGSTTGGTDILNYDPNTSDVLAQNLLVFADYSTDIVDKATPPVAPPSGGGGGGGGGLADPEGVCLAFGFNTLDASPTWTRIDL